MNELNIVLKTLLAFYVVIFIIVLIFFGEDIGTWETIGAIAFWICLFGYFFLRRNEDK